MESDRMMKLYWCSENLEQCHCCGMYILAPTRGKARALYAQYDGFVAYTDVRAVLASPKKSDCKQRVVDSPDPVLEAFGVNYENEYEFPLDNFTGKPIMN